MWNRQKRWERHIQMLVFPFWILNLGLLVESIIGIDAKWIYLIAGSVLTLAMLPYQTLYIWLYDWIRREKTELDEDADMRVLSYWDEPTNLFEEVRRSMMIGAPYQYPQNVVENATGAIKTLPHPSKKHWSNVQKED